MFRKTWYNLERLWSSFKWFFINAFAFRRTLATGRPWDNTHLYLAMADALAQMEDQHRNHGHLVNNEKYANQMKTMRLLLERLIEDKYDLAYREFVHVSKDEAVGQMEKLFGFRSVPKNEMVPVGQYARKASNDTCKNDLRLAAKLFERHSRAWWD